MKRWIWQVQPDLPKAMSNNAVAGVVKDEACHLFSLGGIVAPYGRGNIFSDAYLWIEGAGDWLSIAQIPGPPRLAANAVSVNDSVFVLGGYSVGPLNETSHNLIFQYEEANDVWVEHSPMPIAVDDALVDVWRDRYIVVVSGWSNTSNISDVQIYDSVEARWIEGTTFPGTPVFGQTGAIAGDTILLVDGASADAGFPIVKQRWVGQLNVDEVGVIDWKELDDTSHVARYRSAGASLDKTSIVMTGGTSTPYNFDGKRYDNGASAMAIEESVAFDISTNTFEMLPTERAVPTMDHRSLAKCQERVFVLGGMRNDLAQSANVWSLELQ